MTSAVEIQQPLIEFVADPSDETNCRDIYRRTPAWDNYGREPGWSLEECRRAGQLVATAIVERFDSTPEEIFSMATRVAVQEPPLLGSRLSEFVLGARRVAHGK
jgi:hypothetical protein